MTFKVLDTHFIYEYDNENVNDFIFFCTHFSDIDECLDRTSCGREALCQNAPGTFKCTCPNGLPFDTAARTCTSSLVCSNNDNCPGNAICVNGACNCPEPNVGPDCEGILLSYNTSRVSFI